MVITVMWLASYSLAVIHARYAASPEAVVTSTWAPCMVMRAGSGRGVRPRLVPAGPPSGPSYHHLTWNFTELKFSGPRCPDS